jgi:hypothetical protein
MGVRRNDPRDIGVVLQDAFKRIRALEDAAKTRMFPPGYQISYNSNGDIVITRLSDDATQVLTF